MLERLLFRKVELWFVGLLVIVGLITTLFFGWGVQYRISGGTRAKAVGNALVSVSRAPEPLLKLFDQGAQPQRKSFSDFSGLNLIDPAIEDDGSQHAFSLLKQDQHFKDMHARDPFARRYMAWLLHYEFGSDHRPFEWGVDGRSVADSGSIDYWIRQWLGTYEYLLSVLDNDTSGKIIPVGYELFCRKTESVWGGLKGQLNLQTTKEPVLRESNKEAPEVKGKRELSRAADVFDKLQKV